MIAGYILTGGKNRRMGGEKKLFLRYRERAFYEHLLDALGTFQSIYLSVDEEEPYAQVQLPMVRDLFPGAGPLGGIASGLKLCQEDGLFVVACDMPLLSRSVVEQIADAWDGGITLASVDGRVQPLLGVYAKSTLELMEKRLAKGERKMYDFLREAGCSQVEFPAGCMAAENINTPQDYRKLSEKSE
jgi:molybdopterin-guanine dinucleotide biosynthesis protein A